MGKTFLKIFVAFMLGAGCYLGFIPLFTFIQQHSPVSHDWILDLSTDMQIYAVYGQNLITELVVAVPLILITGISVGFIAGSHELKFGIIASIGILCSYAYFFVSRGRWNEPCWFFVSEIIIWVTLFLITTVLVVKIRKSDDKIIPPSRPGDHFGDVYMP